MKRILLLLITALIILSGASAITACPSGTKSLNFQITNELPSFQHFTVRKSGTAAGFTSVVPNTFVLEPGKSRELVAWITIPSSATPGIYTLVIEAVSENKHEVQSYEIIVEQCNLISITPIQPLSTCISEPLNFEVEIKNNGFYLQEAVLQTSGSESISLNNTIIKLNPGESKKIQASFFSEKEGLETFNIIALAPGIVESRTFNVQVKKCQDFAAYLNKTYIDICENQQTNNTLSIINTGTKTDNYTIITKQGVHSEINEISLSPGELDNIRLSITSTCNVTGKKDKSIIISSRLSGNKTIELTVNERQCQNVILLADRTNEVLCSEEQRTYELQVLNLGEGSSFDVQSNVDWAWVDDGPFSLASGENKTITAEVNIPHYVKGSQDLVFTAINLGVCNVKDDAVIKLYIVDEEECRQMILWGQNKYHAVKGDQIEIPINIRNNGYRKTNYTVETSGAASRWVLGLSDTFLTLRPGETQTVYAVLKINEDYNNLELIFDVYTLDKSISKSYSVILSSEEDKSILTGFTTAITNMRPETGVVLGVLLLIITLSILIIQRSSRVNKEKLLRKNYLLR